MIGVAAMAILSGGPRSKHNLGRLGNLTPLQLLTTSDALKSDISWDIECYKFGSSTDLIATGKGVDMQLIAFFGCRRKG